MNPHPNPPRRPHEGHGATAVCCLRPRFGLLRRCCALGAQGDGLREWRCNGQIWSVVDVKSCSANRFARWLLLWGCCPFLRLRARPLGRCALLALRVFWCCAVVVAFYEYPSCGFCFSAWIWRFGGLGILEVHLMPTRALALLASHGAYHNSNWDCLASV